VPAVSIDCSLYFRNRLDWEKIFNEATKMVQVDGFRHSANLFTLGYPLYIAQSASNISAASRYFVENLKTNKYLFLRFKPLYQCLVASASAYFGVDLFFHPQLAIPGFHLFLSGPGRPYAGGGWHVDQFETAHLVPRRAAWSATLFIGSQSHRYGIDFRKETEAGIQAIPYWHKVGRITLFRSDRVHRIAPMPSDTDCARLTMQAHIAFVDGRGFLFW
jgi:hypothetical protein